MALNGPESKPGLTHLLVPLYLPAALAYFAQGITTTFIVLYALELGARPALAGVIAALPHLGTIIFDLPAGGLTGRLHLKRLYAAGTLAMALIALLIMLLPDLRFYVPLLVLFGASRTIWSISQVAMVRRLVDSAARGRALALMGGMVRFGSFLGPICGGYLAAHFGFGTLFGVSAGLLLPAGMLILLMAPEAGPQTAEGVTRRGSLKEALLRYRGIILTAGTGIVVLGILRSARPVLLPLYGEQIGLEVEQIGLVMGIGGLADALLFYPAGMIYDRFGIKRGAILCLTIFSAGMMLIPLTTGFGSFLTVAILIGIGNGFGAGINMTFSAVLAPDDDVGGFMGMWRLFTDAGLLAGPLAIGTITALAGLSASPLILGLAGLGGALFFKFAVPASHGRH